MAHNLNEVNGKTAFASTQTAWHGLGQIVDIPMNTLEAIQLGGLDYTVEKSPLFSANGKQDLSIFQTIRTDNMDVLGHVSDKYQILQNRNAFDFFDTIVDGGAKIETVGALGKGERIFISSKLPHVVTVGKNDLTEMYLILTTSHDGSGGIKAGLTNVRVVCQNTLNHALSKGLTNSISLRHTKNVVDNVKTAGRIMKHSLEYQMGLEESYNFLFKTKVSDSVAKDLILKIMGTEKSDSTRSKNILEQIENAYNVGIGQEQIIGTAWGVFNGITHYLSHEKKYSSDESRFDSLIKGESANQSSKAFNVLMNYAKTN